MQIELEKSRDTINIGDVISYYQKGLFEEEHLLVTKLRESNSVIKLISLVSTLDRGSYFSLENLQEDLDIGSITISIGVKEEIEITDFHITSKDDILMSLK